MYERLDWWRFGRRVIGTLAVVWSLNFCWAQKASKPAAAARQKVLIKEIETETAEEQDSGPEAKLSPELRSFVKSKATRMLGQLHNGKTVIEFPDGSKQVEKTTVNVIDSEINRTMELVVGYEGSMEAARMHIEKSGFRIVDHVIDGKFFVVVSMPGVVHASELKTIVADSKVRYVSMNRIVGLSNFDFDIQPVKGDSEVSTSNTPNDPYFNQMWGHQNVHAEAAWDEARESTVVVAIVDTGVDLKHPDLNGPDGNLWVNAAEANGVAGQDDDGNGVIDDIHGAAFVGRRRDGSPQDDNGHGTHCAGTIGAIGNNARGVIGLNWRVSIMSVKALDSRGVGANSDVVKSIYYAINNGAQIICNSYGGSPYDPQLKEAIAKAQQKGILFIAAAGNTFSDNDSSNEFPANYANSNIISVAALDRHDKLAYFSNYGRDRVHIAAPGVNIISTYPVAFGSYKFMSGTSMAAPFIAGAAALIWNRMPPSDKPRWQSVRESLLVNSRHMDSLKDTIQGGTVFDLAAVMGKVGPNNPDPKTPSSTRPISTTPLPISPGKGEPAESVGRSDRFVSQQKVFDEHVLRGKGNLLSVEFELKQAATVRITAHTSVHTTQNNSISVGTGLSPNGEFAGEFWKESWRGLTVPADGQTVSLSSNFITELPAGKHKIFWRVFTANETDELRFSEGASLIVDIDQGAKAPVSQTPAHKEPLAKTPHADPAPAKEAPKEETVIKVPMVKLPSDRSRDGVKAPTNRAQGTRTPVVEVPNAEATPSDNPD